MICLIIGPALGVQYYVASRNDWGLSKVSSAKNALKSTAGMERCNVGGVFCLLVYLFVYFFVYFDILLFLLSFHIHS